jgi:hypothetical protein
MGPALHSFPGGSNPLDGSGDTLNRRSSRERPSAFGGLRTLGPGSAGPKPRNQLGYSLAVARVLVVERRQHELFFHVELDLENNQADGEEQERPSYARQNSEPRSIPRIPV